MPEDSGCSRLVHRSPLHQQPPDREPAGLICFGSWVTAIQLLLLASADSVLLGDSLLQSVLQMSCPNVSVAAAD